MATVIVKLGQSATEFEVNWQIGRAIETLLHHIKGFNYHRIENLEYKRVKDGNMDKRNAQTEVSDTD